MPDSKHGGDVVGPCRYWIEKPRRHRHATFNRDIRDINQMTKRNAPDTPIMEARRREAKLVFECTGTNGFDKRVMGVPLNHVINLHGALIQDNIKSLISKHDLECFAEAMKKELSDRLRTRIHDEMKLSQAAVAKELGMSPQRLGNYVQGIKLPDIVTLKRIAEVLKTSTDWLLGISEAGPPEIAPVLLRVLELEGMNAERAGVVLATVQAALQIQRALPNEGDPLLRSRLAAQAAWQSQHLAKPS